MVRRLIKTIAMLLSVSIIISMFSGVYAAAATSWDGTTPLVAGKSYTVSTTVRIKNNLTIPTGTTLYIKPGGNLLIHKGVNLSVYGELKINAGATATNSGTISVYGAFGVAGTLYSSVSGTIAVRGKMLVYTGAVMKSSSRMLVYGTGTLTSSGELYMLKSSTTLVSGAYTITKSGNLYLDGSLAVSLSGKTTVGGYLRVGADSVVTISGRMALVYGSVYTRFGTVKKTASGILIDRSKVVAIKDATVAILVDEPDVKLKGIDVSYAQGDIDWAKVAAAGVDFAIIRAARGAINEYGCKVDTYFYKNIAGAIENGIDVGVYMYSYATTVDEAKTEADFLLSTIAGYKLTFPVIYDLEEEMGDIENVTSMAEVFIDTVSTAGYYPMIYSYQYWLETYLDPRVLDKYAIWMANLYSPTDTFYGGNYMRQYSFTGKVDGINGNVDLDFSYRDFPTILKKYGWNNL